MSSDVTSERTIPPFVVLNSMYYIYILQSIQFPSKIYIGFTQYSPDKRLDEHNSGSTDHTKQYKPWKLIYYEAFTDKQDAQDREKSLKQYGGAWRKIKDRLGNTLGTKKGGIDSSR